VKAGLALALALVAAAPATEIQLSGQPQQGALLRGTAPRGTTALSLDGKPIPVGEDGAFLIGFDRDAPPQSKLVAEWSGGTLVRLLTVAPRAWDLERVDTPLRQGIPNEDFQRIRAAELARIAAARAVEVKSGGWRQRFAWPARGRISGVFGSQRIYQGEPGSYHSGVDIAAGAGAVVTAPADGVVVLAGPPVFSLEGNMVIVSHGMGLDSAFLHLATVAVKEGQQVRQGDPIGTVGATGRATGPHLHWSMKWQSARIDPQPLAGAMPPAPPSAGPTRP
jgi:murein DD-endopeptidase MepM/ murein hydrolase activator NlpD